MSMLAIMQDFEMAQMLNALEKTRKEDRPKFDKFMKKWENEPEVQELLRDHFPEWFEEIA